MCKALSPYSSCKNPLCVCSSIIFCLGRFVQFLLCEKNVKIFLLSSYLYEYWNINLHLYSLFKNSRSVCSCHLLPFFSCPSGGLINPSPLWSTRMARVDWMQSTPGPTHRQWLTFGRCVCVFMAFCLSQCEFYSPAFIHHNLSLTSQHKLFSVKWDDDENEL